MPKAKALESSPCLESKALALEMESKALVLEIILNNDFIEK
jgi:hypothetical protein